MAICYEKEGLIAQGAGGEARSASAWANDRRHKKE
jgi:hypothetical protein